MTISIEKFYQQNTIDPDFDAEFYLDKYPETQNFYEPYCSTNGIDLRHKLFYHWYYYGHNRAKNLYDVKNLFMDWQSFTPPSSLNNKLCIIVHAYYYDIWITEILPEIQKIAIPFDLYITIPQNDTNRDQILKIFPNAHIIFVENRGSDIWPFIKTLQYINNCNMQYDYILKLHTKKSLNTDPWYTKYLRKNIYQNLCKNICFIIEKMNQIDSIGMIGCPETRMILDEATDSANLENINKYRKILNIQNNELNFIFGTMFCTRFKIINQCLSANHFVAEDFEEGHSPNGMVAHAFERLFANIIRDNNQSIYCLGDKNLLADNIDQRSVLWVVPSISIGGGLRVILEIANAQKQLGYNVQILNISETNSADWYQKNTVPILSTTNKHQAQKWISDQDYDYIFATGYQTIDLVNSSNAKNKIHFIQDYEELFGKSVEYIQQFLDNKPIDDRSQYPFYNNIVISNWLRNQIFHRHHIHSHVIKLGVDKTRDVQLQNHKQRKDILVYYKYNNHFGRGSDLVLSFLEQIQDKSYSVTVFGHNKPDIIEKFNWVGEKTGNELAELYSEHRLFLDFSRHRGIATISMECAAHGVISILMSPGIGLEEYGFQHLKNCILVDNLLDMQIYIDKILNNINLEESIRDNVYKLYNNFDSWLEVATNIDNLIYHLQFARNNSISYIQ